MQILLLLTTLWAGIADTASKPKFKLLPAPKVVFNSFVDCNMAEVWVGDTFRIFPGKYGEDPLWGYAKDLKYSDGPNASVVFQNPAEKFINPAMPPNVPIGKKGLHGAVWFETVYQDKKDASGKTLYALYHNENYPITLPYDPKTKEGYTNSKLWPQGLTGPESPAAVCRIGIMKSLDGGKSWENKGIILEDLDPRMILKPHNTSNTFAGGVGDPSAVASGDYLYVFYGEYGYPGVYNPSTYNPSVEAAGQCISIARIALKDLDNPVGKAKRWDGKGFTIAHNSFGKPVKSLQIPLTENGGPASSPTGGFHWGPSVSWNTYLNCWVMLMGRVEGKSWIGDKIYISFNPNQDLGAGNNSQQWSKPELLFQKPGYILWYPSLQPLDSEEDIREKYTSTRLGKKARFFVKRIKPEDDSYASEHIIEFEKYRIHEKIISIVDRSK
ncbi:hypothetical protein [Sediminibacterium sp.]|uniref:hypothetical protein n=1 Tax=Sediminibacterium sp. TaxID=1917865 RepID=UPI003F69858C